MCMYVCTTNYFILNCILGHLCLCKFISLKHINKWLGDNWNVFRYPQKVIKIIKRNSKFKLSSDRVKIRFLLKHFLLLILTIFCDRRCESKGTRFNSRLVSHPIVLEREMNLQKNRYLKANEETTFEELSSHCIKYY